MQSQIRRSLKYLNSSNDQVLLAKTVVKIADQIEEKYFPPKKVRKWFNLPEPAFPFNKDDVFKGLVEGEAEHFEDGIS